MKFDITRTAKDENDRQSMSNAELSENELNEVCGGDGFDAYGASASSSSSHSEFRGHSYALLCDINIFSADIHVIGLDRLINIGNCETRPCLNND